MIQFTWDIFRAHFLDNYFPKHKKHGKELEFFELKQGNMSVGEYIGKFQQQSKFSMYYQNHPDKRWKCRKFEAGLKPELRRVVRPMKIRDFATLVNKCRIVEEQEILDKIR
jgi:hypothetical protein